ncbi:MAG: sulfate ABC transporter substrate-binding protein [Planctomycetes bacterium]|nr:sulfate ABC transporter substrate-binding protein [Planctomycetota bacterium]
MKRFDFEFLFSGTNAAFLGGFVAFLLLFLAIQPIQKRPVSTKLELLHVSFDPTREVIHEINEAFAQDWKKFKDGRVQIFQSHGGSGSQARSIADGLPADIASFALFTDMEAIAKKKLLHSGWERTKGVVSPPWGTAIVFLVRKGNPKKIRDWNDLVQPGVGIITPNPKISGNGRLVFLSAWGYILEKGGSDSEAREFLKKIYKNVPVMDASARASQVTFFQKKIGDVQLHLKAKRSWHSRNPRASSKSSTLP